MSIAAASSALLRYSQYRLILDIKSIRAAQRQSAALCLGSIRYDRCASHIEKAVGVLLAQLAVGTKVSLPSAECARSMCQLRMRVDDGVS